MTVCLSVSLSAVSLSISVCVCACSANDGCLYVYDRERSERTLKVCAFIHFVK